MRQRRAAGLFLSSSVQGSRLVSLVSVVIIMMAPADQANSTAKRMPVAVLTIRVLRSAVMPCRSDYD
jgi:hypothetical protein